MDRGNGNIKKQKRDFWISSCVKAVLLMGIVIFATLIAYKIPWIYDMTKDKLFTLSQESKDIINTTEEKIDIAVVYPEGKEDKLLMSLLDEYDKETDNISVEYIDLEREPTKLAKYNLSLGAVTNGTIIVKTADKNKIIMDTSLYSQTEAGSAFAGERLISGAIKYVTTDEMPVVYITEGHSEAQRTGEMGKAMEALELNSYEVRDLNLIKMGGVPEDCSMIIVPSPKKDITEEELSFIEGYLNKGGKAFFMIDAMSTNTEILINFNKLLNTYGIDIHNNFVVEEEKQNFLGNNNMYLIPSYAYHSITESMAEDRNYCILPIAMGLRSVPVDESNVKINHLMLTSNKSWMRADMTIQSGEKTEVDISGPIPVSTAVVKSNAKLGEKDSKVVIIGNSSFIYDANIDAQGNRDFFLNCVNWLLGEKTTSSISPKIINADSFMVRGNDFNKLAILCIIILPLIAFTGAFMVWLFRRNQ